MFVLSVLNKKGGVGKTTITTNLGQGLTILGKKVLVIDNDGQHNLSSSLGIKSRKYDKGLADLFVAPPEQIDTILNDAIYQGIIEGLYCIPPGNRELNNVKVRPTALEEILKSKIIRKYNYDVVLIDNAPAIGDNTVCAIKASTHFLLPVQLRQFSLDGLAEMYQILQVQHHIKQSQIMIVRNMYKQTIKSRQLASDSVAASYSECCLETIIPEDETFERMIAGGKSMFFSSTRSNATMVFHDLICEIFGWDKDKMLDILADEIKKYRASIAKENLSKKKLKRLFVSSKEGE